MSIGDFPESLNQAILTGIMLVGRWGVSKGWQNKRPPLREKADAHHLMPVSVLRFWISEVLTQAES